MPPTREALPPSSAGQEGRGWDQGFRLFVQQCGSKDPPQSPLDAGPSPLLTSHLHSPPLPILCSGLTISMEPSLESCLPTAGLLCPFPYLLPLERGQSLVMCGGQAPPGSLVREWTDRTAAPQHPPWGTGPRDGHPGEGVLDHDDHNLKRQQPSVFCALLFLLFIPQQL